MFGKAVYVGVGGGFDSVSMGRVETSAPAAGEIRVKLHASSLNYHDYIVVSGMWGPSENRIPMSDGAGEVVEVGEGVSDFKVGDKVVSLFFRKWVDGPAKFADFAAVPGDGVDGYAREEVTLPAEAFTHAPVHYSHLESATLTTAAVTAWKSVVVDGAVRPGSTVLVQGTGGVSIFALQFAKMAGATVIATSSDDAKLSRMKSLGADHLINYKKEANWGEAVMEMTQKSGVDIVVDVGGPSTIDQSMIAAKIGGHVSLIGVLTGFQGSMSMITAIAKSLKLQGVLVGSRQHQVEMIRALNSSNIKPVIDSTFELEDIVKAFKHQESGKHFGKICLKIA